MSFKSFCAVTICSLCILLPIYSGPAYAAAEPEKAIAFVRNLTEKGINDILGADITQEEKTDRFRKMFVDALDLEHIGKFVLSRHWRKATTEQRKAFIDAFTEVSVLTWANRFDEYSGQDIDISGTHPSQNKSHIFVDSAVEMGKGPVEVIWRLHERKDGTYRIIDIIVEKVSMAMTYRNEYGTIINGSQNGIDDLIEKIKRKIKFLEQPQKEEVKPIPGETH